jgi:hypothetical protein
MTTLYYDYSLYYRPPSFGGALHHLKEFGLTTYQGWGVETSKTGVRGCTPLDIPLPRHPALFLILIFNIATASLDCYHSVSSMECSIINE